MSMIKIRNLCKSFQTDQGDVHVVKDLNIDVERGSFFTLLGPSGCGKTTTLRCVMGLEIPDRGEIYLAERKRGGYKDVYSTNHT